MEFRYATKEDREVVENLWAYCFEPKGDPFFTYYFNEVYKPEETLVGYEKGGHGKEQVLADVHLRPYRLSVRQKAMDVAYIVGVATHPAARRSGIGGQLLKASLQALREKGHSLNILMPSMAVFYHHYGWDMYCHQWIRRMKLEDLRPLADRSLDFCMIDSPDEWFFLASIYEAYTANLTGYAIRSEGDWRRLLGSIFAEGAHVVVVYEDNAPAGYMFYKLGAPEIFVSEFVYASRKAQRALLGFLYNHRSQGESLRWNEGLHDKSYIFYPNGQSGNEVLPFMMSRIVDTKKALEEVPYERSYLAEKESVEIHFLVEDPLADWNAGHFVATYTAKGATVKVVKTAPSKAALTAHVGVGALSLLLMGRLTASELAYEGKMTGSVDALDELDALYPKMDTYVNEWY